MVPNNRGRAFFVTINYESSSAHELGAAGVRTHVQDEMCSFPRESFSLTEETRCSRRTVNDRAQQLTTKLWGTLQNAGGLLNERPLLGTRWCLTQASTVGRAEDGKGVPGDSYTPSVAAPAW